MRRGPEVLPEGAVNADVHPQSVDMADRAEPTEKTRVSSVQPFTEGATTEKCRPARPAMRAFCRQCMAGSHAEIKKCLASRPQPEVCQIQVFRQSGRRAGGQRAIRRECLLCNRCTNFSHPTKDAVEGVAQCPSTQCPLWPHRFGIRPQTALKRGYNVGRTE